MMLNIFNNANSPFYRFGQAIFMQKIAKKDWIPFIQQSFEKRASLFPLIWQRICNTVSCHFLVSATTLLFHLEFHGFKVTEEVFALGLKQVLNINTPCSKTTRRTCSSTQIEMLKAIADGEQHFSSQAVKQIYNLGNP